MSDDMKQLALRMAGEACIDRSGDDARHEVMKDLLIQGQEAIINLLAEIDRLNEAGEKVAAQCRVAESAFEILEDELKIRKSE